MPDRATRTHVVPGNIMSVEFKLFDFMTLKQFLYLVVCAFLSYVFISTLPGIFRIVIPAIIMVSGIIIAFVQVNGEPFEVYTTNFLLGIIQPQRRVWSKTIIKKTNPKVIDDSDATIPTKQIKTFAENYVPEEEIIPIDYNKSVTDIDLQEQAFLHTSSTDKPVTVTNTTNLPGADLSQLNFDFALSDNSDEKKETNDEKPLINLVNVNDLNNNINSGNMNVPSNNISVPPIISNSGSDDFEVKKEENMNINTINNTPPAFVIDMDENDNSSSSLPPFIQTNTTQNNLSDTNNMNNADFIKGFTNNIDDTKQKKQDFISGAILDTTSNQTVQQPIDIDIPSSNVSVGSNNTVSNFNIDFNEDNHTEQLQNNDQTDNFQVLNGTPLNLNNSNNESPEPILLNSFGDDQKNTEEPIVISTNEIPRPIEDNNLNQLDIKANSNELNNTPSISQTPVVSNDVKEEIKIHGRVISSNGGKITGLVIALYDLNGKAIESSITNENGEFKFNEIPKSFEIKIWSPQNKKYLFSPMDKATKEILIHESSETKSVEQPVIKPVEKPQEHSDFANKLPDATELTAVTPKIPNAVNGVIKDESGHYLAGVLISIKDQNGTTIRALASNPLGQFFSNTSLVNGQYNLHFEKDGFKFEPYTVVLDGKIYNPKVYIGKSIN